MSDGNHGFALHQGFKAFLDGRFHFGVQRRGGLVHDQDRCVLEQYPGNGDALALAPRQLDPALTHVGVEAAAALGIGQVGDELVGAGLAYRLPEFFIGGVRFAVQQVVADRAMQQRGVLGDHADLFAQAFLSDFGNILTVDQDSSALQVVQAQQQVDQR